MNDKIKKTMEYVKNHKKEILIGTFVTIGGICCYKVIKNNPFKEDYKIIPILKPSKVELPVKLDVGDVGSCTRYDGGTVELWLDNVSLKDMGALGEDISEKISGISDDSKVWALLDIRNVTES